MKSHFNSRLASTPPMGWNSWDGFSVTINEQEMRENAKFIAEHLKPFGWEYVVLDLGWYAPGADRYNYKQDDIPVVIDEFGRFLPCPEKFPSSANGQGLKPLADYVHSLGLKFGLHIMRGIPLQAVKQKTPVKGTRVTADQIAYDRENCPWFNSMQTLNFALPQAQAYYDSIFELYAQWGVDYIKADDVNAWHEVHNSDGSPTGTGSPYRVDDIEGIASAIKSCGRDMLLSLSPGGPETTLINHLRNHANLWRISADFWDEWGSLKKQMQRCAIWAPFAISGHWPDADMLPIGFMPRGESGEANRHSNFNEAELHTLMTLWCICRSPLMIGGDLPRSRAEILPLLTNSDAISVNQHSTNNHRLFSQSGGEFWFAQSTLTDAAYVAILNTNDIQHTFTFEFSALPGKLRQSAQDVWQRYSVSADNQHVSVTLGAHDSVLLKLA
ncbi:glycoside hydrolase family 27 protein [Alteromonas aestuariivivens]|nr:glycoside hydrolase family 27 protein [Alteromonas aestuariivivens]